MTKHATADTAALPGLPRVVPAAKYERADDLWIVSCFFNSNAYASKSRNFESFIAPIERSGLNFLIVECAFGRQPFSLKRSRNILRVRTPDVMWQKERLLNIALKRLPARCRKVAWVDCDVLFERPDWARATSEELERSQVVQPFREAIRLPKEGAAYSGLGHRYPGFGCVLKSNPKLVSKGDYNLHGHTGFAWAARRSVLERHGLYDACIAGTGDHLMAHAWAGDWSTGCVKETFGANERFRRHYVDWCERVHPWVRSSVGYVDGVLLHLWHGDYGWRQYGEHQRFLQRCLFDPARDLRLNKNSCWEWNGRNAMMKTWASRYFALRKEDS